MQQYYIVSLKHTRREDRYISFWRDRDAGYAYPLSWAGQYDAERVLERPQYYHNQDTTIAVRCELVDALGVAPIPGLIDGDAGPVVPNTPESWKVVHEGKVVIEEPYAQEGKS